MTDTEFEVIIVGGSYSGLATAMALGRALRKVLIIDSGKPCNRQTPHSHNFITQDGKTPKQISDLAAEQVKAYPTVHFLDDLVTDAKKSLNSFSISTANGDSFTAKRLVFATGIHDIMPEIEGFSDCWGISVLHCPYCHGYEVRKKTTGILGNGDFGFEFSRLISNWTDNLSLYTNGASTLSKEETELLKSRNINIVETKIIRFEHIDGYVKNIHFQDGSQLAVDAIYARLPFKQHCTAPEKLGCKLNEKGYVVVDEMQKTTVEGVYACGDNTTKMRTVANAVAMGTNAGMMLNKEYVLENF
ncbi:NAD(P)/FAD-dependent oxidoreductase [Winogradskyella sp. HL2-2]|uniref:NAD(P)/FAD-dependent oxidoreductase n=2 Tax=Winogradskyella endarachnes TaxID=2681965 RepID=A0A6L6UCM6_9FLAO|nr:NAD(P)/FAD-dependent oxidoreductase [Winogradskyella endarachnes]